MDSVATLPPAARADSVRHDRRDGALTQPDPDIESVVVLRPPAAVGVSALAAGLHARLGKPLRWFGRREPSLAWQRLTADTPGEFAEIVACLLLADRSGPATHTQIDAYLRMLRELAPSLPATFAAPPVDDEAARAEALDRLCAELDMQIGITIERTDGSPIAGTRLRGVAEAAGFRLAPSGRFEWVQEETGHVVYTMQAISGEPFTLDTLRTASLGGIVFVLDVPCVNEPARAFDQMKLAAGRLAHTLGGDMVDDNRRVLTDEALANTRAAVAKAAAALRRGAHRTRQPARAEAVLGVTRAGSSSPAAGVAADAAARGPAPAAAAARSEALRRAIRAADQQLLRRGCADDRRRRVRRAVPRARGARSALSGAAHARFADAARRRRARSRVRAGRASRADAVDPDEHRHDRGRRRGVRRAHSPRARPGRGRAAGRLLRRAQVRRPRDEPALRARRPHRGGDARRRRDRRGRDRQRAHDSARFRRASRARRRRCSRCAARST